MKYLHTYYNERSIKDHPFEIDQSKHYHTIVVIPAHDESLEILEKTMKSLLMNKQTAHQYLCLVLINHRASDSDEIGDASASLFKQLKARYQDAPAWIDIQIRYQVFDQKKAGVG
ncbi:MAG: hypothetical protein HKN09_09960, partial [Saprospiraceae bacterium]|nr:hypothetical protein [Saprospiraceae bacterium]